MGKTARSSRRRARPRAAFTSEPPTRFGRDASMIFAVALAVRLAHLWAMRRSPFFDVLLGDAHVYDAWARQIVGGDYVGHDVFYQAPLYAYFLAAVYTLDGSLLLVRVCQAVIGAGACVLLGIAAQRLFGRPAGLVAGLMLAVYAPQVFFDGLIQKSVLDTFFLCLVLALLCGFPNVPERPGTTTSRWRVLGVGLALGALSLTRENALIFVPVLLGWILLRSRASAISRLALASTLLAGVAIVLVPVGFRNWIAGGEFHLTTAQSGPNLFIGNNPQADGSYIPLRVGRGSPEYERLDATETASRAAGRTLSPGEVSSYWTGKALEYVRTHPGDWLALEGRKFRLLWNRTEAVDTESQESHQDFSPVLRLLGHAAHFGMLAPLACFGMWITWRERRQLWLVHALLAAYIVTLLVFYVVARYRLPLVPLLIVFATAALTRGVRFVAAERRGVAILGAAALGVVAIFCNLPVVSADMLRAVTYQNLGASLQEAGRLDEAASAYRRALTLEPGYAPAHNNLAAVLRQQGHAGDAVKHFEEALRLRPDFEDASFNLANALADGGKNSDAIARYEELLHHRPDAADIHSNLAIALVRAERLDEAIEHFRQAARLAPGTAKVHYNLGHSMLTRGDLTNAVDQLSLAVQIDPADASARYELGNAYLAQQRQPEAIVQFREALRLSPAMAEAHNNLGIALGSLGKLDEAVQEFKEALRLNPTFDEAQANLKSALNARGAPRLNVDR